MSASPMASTARAAALGSLTGPLYSSTTAISPPPSAELWSYTGGTRPASAQMVPQRG